jgi:hypothetical protein
MVLELSVCDGSSCPCNDSNKGVDFPSCDSKCLYEWVVLVVFSSDDNAWWICCGKMWVLWSEFGGLKLVEIGYHWGLQVHIGCPILI